MKHVFTALTLTLLLAACGGPIGPVPPEAREADAPVAEPTPPPQAVAPAPQMAPPGHYFLLERVAVMTGEGVVAHPAGTMVQQVAPGLFDFAGTLHELDPAKVTNDLDRVSELIARQRAQEWANYQARVKAAQAARAPAQPAPSPTPEPAVWQPEPQQSIVRDTPREAAPPAPIPQAEPAPVPEAVVAQPPTAEEQIATRTYDTDSGIRYQVRVRGAEVSD